MISPATSPNRPEPGKINSMAHNPPRRLAASEIHTISRAFGITVSEMIDTVKRVEQNRCNCGDLACHHRNESSA